MPRSTRPFAYPQHSLKQLNSSQTARLSALKLTPNLISQKNKLKCSLQTCLGLCKDTQAEPEVERRNLLAPAKSA